jgi:hypothetical protein
MIEFAAPMYLGLTAAAVPLLLHIAHRRRYQRVRWGAMRFLQNIISARQRRLAFENLLLLCIRSGLILCVVGALMRPQLTLRAEGLGDLIPRSGRTAAVLVIDDGMSTTAPPTDPAWGRLQRLAHAYLDTLKTGDEVTIVPWSRISEPLADPLVDLASAHQAIDRLQPTALACDVPSLLAAGLDRFAVHLNPEAELVLLSDGRARAFALDEPERWERLRQRLLPVDDSPLGSRARPHLILLQPPPPHTPLTNCSVDALQVDRSLLPSGSPATIRATIRLEGAHALSGLLVRLLIDNRTVEERPLALIPGQQLDIAFSYLFSEAGSHLIEVSVEGAHDALPQDDRRGLAVEVESSLPVLLVEGVPGHGLAGSLGLAAAALAPQEDLAAGGATPPVGASAGVGMGDHLFSIARCGVSGLTEERLSTVRVVVVGDVPALDAGAVSALERFVSAGGGVLVVAGGNTDEDIANRFWWRGGDGFLPGRLGLMRDLQPPGHPLLGPPVPALETLTRAGNEPWQEVAVSRLHLLEEVPADATRLLTLEDGSPLLIERPRGRGRVALLGCGIDGRDSTLPYRGAFVALMRCLCTELGGSTLPRRNLLAGDALTWIPPAGGADGALLPSTASGPQGLTVALHESTWEGRQAVVSAALPVPGAYIIHPTGSARPVWFDVGTDPALSQLADRDPRLLERALTGVPRHVVDEPQAVSQLFSAAGNRSWDLWRALVAAAVVLLVCESVCTRMMARAEREPPAEGRA